MSPVSHSGLHLLFHGLETHTTPTDASGRCGGTSQGEHHKRQVFVPSPKQSEYQTRTAADISGFFPQGIRMGHLIVAAHFFGIEARRGLEKIAVGTARLRQASFATAGARQARGFTKDVAKGTTPMGAWKIRALLPRRGELKPVAAKWQKRRHRNIFFGYPNKQEGYSNAILRENRTGKLAAHNYSRGATRRNILQHNE
jgi:hypothetical protein